MTQRPDLYPDMEKQILPAIAAVLNDSEGDLEDSFVYSDYAIDALVGGGFTLGYIRLCPLLPPYSTTGLENCLLP